VTRRHSQPRASRRICPAVRCQPAPSAQHCTSTTQHDQDVDALPSATRHNHHNLLPQVSTYALAGDGDLGELLCGGGGHWRSFRRPPQQGGAGGGADCCPRLDAPLCCLCAAPHHRSHAAYCTTRTRRTLPAAATHCIGPFHSTKAAKLLICDIALTEDGMCITGTGTGTIIALLATQPKRSAFRGAELSVLTSSDLLSTHPAISPSHHLTISRFKQRLRAYTTLRET